MSKRRESATLVAPPELSYVHGSSDVALIGDTLGAYFDKIVARFGDREALVVASCWIGIPMPMQACSHWLSRREESSPAGRFSSVGTSVTRNHLAALDANGMFTAWNPGANSRVTSLAVSADGTVYAGGFFRSVGDGIARNRLAAFDASGAVRQWDPDLDDWVTNLEISGSTVYVAGRFRHVGEAASGGLAAMDAGTADLIAGWQDPRIIGGAHALVVHRGTVYAAGGFVARQGDDRRHLFTFDAQTGELNPGWNPGLDDFAAALAVADDTIYVGGSFGAVDVNEEMPNEDSLRRSRLAAFPVLDEDGGVAPKHCRGTRTLLPIPLVRRYTSWRSVVQRSTSPERSAVSMLALACYRA